MFKKLIAWITKKRWTLKEQVFHLEQLIRSDNQWLAHDPIARAITDRYLQALSDDWHSKSFESSALFRQRLNRDPHHPKKTPIEVIERRIIESRNVITHNETLLADKMISEECLDSANSIVSIRLKLLESLVEEIKQLEEP